VNENRRRIVHDLLVFGLLVAIGVTGRWNEPQWGFTPTAAATILAGYFFSRWQIAAMVPLSILAITDLLLPAHDNLAVMVATYAVMTLPIWLGRMMARGGARWSRAWRWAVCGLLPATLFFVVTNFAVWAFQSDYEKTASGLMECYWAAVPFYRWMLAGDVFYVAVLLVCWSLAARPAAQAALAPERVRR
jgi:hypothetical protein